MSLTSQDIKKALKQVLEEQARQDDAKGIQPNIFPPLKEQPTPVNSSVLTRDVIDSLLRQKQYKGIKEGSVKTYTKHLNRFARAFPALPLDTETVMNYVGQYGRGTGRYKRNQHDLLNLLYKHAVRSFEVSENPFDNLERPVVTPAPIRTLSLSEAAEVDKVTDTISQKAVWELTFGHGWRQIEVRRITAGDVRSISDGTIRCRGKEREEATPLLPETQQLLEQLATGLSDDDTVIRSTRLRGGVTQPLGADGISQLIQRLFKRTGLKYLGHDLRRSFCTLVREASGDEFLAMRLARDKIPGVNDRYINTSPVKLRQSLLKHSPVRLIRHQQAGETRLQAGESLVEAGESRTPRPREATQNILQA